MIAAVVLPEWAAMLAYVVFLAVVFGVTMLVGRGLSR